MIVIIVVADVPIGSTMHALIVQDIYALESRCSSDSRRRLPCGYVCSIHYLTHTRIIYIMVLSSERTIPCAIPIKLTLVVVVVLDRSRLSLISLLLLQESLLLLANLLFLLL